MVQRVIPDRGTLFGGPGNSIRLREVSSPLCRAKGDSLSPLSHQDNWGLCQSLSSEGLHQHKGSYGWMQKSESCLGNPVVVSRLQILGQPPVRSTLTCRSGRTVSPCPCSAPPTWFLSKIRINGNPYFHTALAVWICKCLFNAPTPPSTLSEHVALYKGSWDADTAWLSPS